MKARHFTDLIAWQKAMDLVETVYGVTEQFPQREMFGLSNQLRRAALSVPSNIAEGQGRNSCREFVQFHGIAKGSLQEVETQLRIAIRLKFIPAERETELLGSAAEVARILNGLLSSLTTDH